MSEQVAEPDSNLRASVREWAREYIRHVGVLQVQGVDLDELITLAEDKEVMLRQAFVAYRALVEYVGAMDFPVQPTLVIPLLERDRLVLERPDSFAALVKDLHEWTPPNLYLIDWHTRIQYRRLVVYQCPTTLPIDEALPANTVVYYETRCHVSEAPDEWPRDMRVEYYPPHHQSIQLPDV